ncbi:MAG: hypothetical protein GQF41_0438 [Candidatus Rifleibacterium amylolyticum]|nr:MAG: hypothetical protein GQF41_0438 [Candidatus Rifleibacterium amylolyticum]
MQAEGNPQITPITPIFLGDSYAILSAKSGFLLRHATRPCPREKSGSRESLGHGFCDFASLRAECRENAADGMTFRVVNNN